jgi:type II secretion system protein H
MNLQTRKNRRLVTNGFTLIELMAVIAIIGMVFAIGIPRLNSSKMRALRNDAESIAASLDFARQRAVMTSVPHRVLIDLEEGGYRIEWYVDEARSTEAIDGGEGNSADDEVDRASDVSNGQAVEVINFHPPNLDERDYYPIPSRQFGSFTWLHDARYFVGLDSSSGWIESGDVEIVFDADGTTEYSQLEIADAEDNHLTLEIEPLLNRVRRRDGGARS